MYFLEFRSDPEYGSIIPRNRSEDLDPFLGITDPKHCHDVFKIHFVPTTNENMYYLYDLNYNSLNKLKTGFKFLKKGIYKIDLLYVFGDNQII